MIILEQLVSGIRHKIHEINHIYGSVSMDKMLLVMRKEDMHELFKIRYADESNPHLSMTSTYLLKVMGIKVITAPDEVLKGKLFLLSVIL